MPQAKEVDENAPLLALPATVSPGVPRLHQTLGVIALGMTMVICSAGLINLNKYLLQANRFPFPMYLVAAQMASGFLCLLGLRFIFPSLFPSLTEELPLGARDLFCRVLPIAAVFSASLVLSNVAYMFSSVSFLQMMKECNIVLVYVVSLGAGLEVFRSRNVFVLLLVTIGTVVNVRGELRFSWTGFAVQAVGQSCEVLKLVLQQILLSERGLKLDALTYNLVVMPLCLLCVCALLVVRSLLPLIGFHASVHVAPSWEDVRGSAPVVALSLMMALALNISIALFIKHSSAVSFVLAQVFKDVLVVFASVRFTAAIVSPAQVFGFALQIAGVSAWSLMKVFPKELERGEAWCCLPGRRASKGDGGL